MNYAAEPKLEKTAAGLNDVIRTGGKIVAQAAGREGGALQSLAQKGMRTANEFMAANPEHVLTKRIQSALSQAPEGAVPKGKGIDPWGPKPAPQPGAAAAAPKQQAEPQPQPQQPGPAAQPKPDAADLGAGEQQFHKRMSAAPKVDTNKYIPADIQARVKANAEANVPGADEAQKAEKAQREAASPKAGGGAAASPNQGAGAAASPKVDHVANVKQKISDFLTSAKDAIPEDIRGHLSKFVSDSLEASKPPEHLLQPEFLLHHRGNKLIYNNAYRGRVRSDRAPHIDQIRAMGGEGGDINKGYEAYRNAEKSRLSHEFYNAPPGEQPGMSPPQMAPKKPGKVGGYLKNVGMGVGFGGAAIGGGMAFGAMSNPGAAGYEA